MSSRCKLRQIVLAALVAVGLSFLPGGETNGHGYGAQSVPEAKAGKLLSLAKSIDNHSQDFFQMASSRKGDPEFELLMYLHNTAKGVSERLGADYIMISMYEGTQCREDRARVRHYVSEHFGHEGKLIDFDIGSVNTALAYSQISAAAQLGAQMKNELRGARETLDSIVASLE